MSNETGDNFIGMDLSSTDSGIGEDDNEPLLTERSLGFLRRRREKARKRLYEALDRVEAAGPFLRMIWAIDRISEGDRKALSRFPRRRPELVEWHSNHITFTSGQSSPWSMHIFGQSSCGAGKIRLFELLTPKT